MALDNILIIEDDAFHATILSRLLKSLTSATIAVANNGQQGLDAIALATPDLIFCDLYMPDMDGVEFLRHFAEIDITPDIVVTSIKRNINRNFK